MTSEASLQSTFTLDVDRLIWLARQIAAHVEGTNVVVAVDHHDAEDCFNVTRYVCSRVKSETESALDLPEPECRLHRCTVLGTLDQQRQSVAELAQLFVRAASSRPYLLVVIYAGFVDAEGRLNVLYTHAM
jgi:hypothetical protein